MGSKQEAIAVMLDSFPQAKLEVDNLMTIFSGAVFEFDDCDVEAACRKYVTGKVERSNHAFAPSVAEFVKQVESQKEFREIQSRPRIENHTKPKLSPSHFSTRYQNGEFDSIAAGGPEAARKRFEQIQAEQQILESAKGKSEKSVWEVSNEFWDARRGQTDLQSSKPKS